MANSGTKKGIKGLSMVSIFPITDNSAEKYSVSEKKSMPHIQAFTAEPEAEEYKILADDVTYDQGADLTGLKVTITMAELDLPLRQALEGGNYDEAKQIYSFAATSVAPQLAMTFRTLLRNGGYYLWKYYCFKVSTVKADLTTKGASKETPVTIEGFFTPRACDGKLFDIKSVDAGADASWLDTIDAFPAVGG